jgi:hypothetical protein
VVLAIVGGTYYAVVFVAVVPSMRQAASSPVACVLNLLATLFFTFCVGMLVWSYFAAMLTDPGRVGKKTHTEFTRGMEKFSWRVVPAK